MTDDASEAAVLLGIVQLGGPVQVNTCPGHLSEVVERGSVSQVSGQRKQGLVMRDLAQLIRQRERDGCFQAFRLNHWLGATLFAGIALGLATT